MQYLAYETIGINKKDKIFFENLGFIKCDYYVFENLSLWDIDKKFSYLRYQNEGMILEWDDFSFKMRKLFIHC